jgi:hypothetical protein
MYDPNNGIGWHGISVWIQSCTGYDTKIVAAT